MKDHWYHVRLLRDVWKPVMQARAAALRDLSRRLGHDRDLVLLVGALGELTPRIGARPAGALLGAAGARRRELQRVACIEGARLFAEKPAQLTRRVGRYWEAWHAEHAASAAR